jgi:hypothetical protein
VTCGPTRSRMVGCIYTTHRANDGCRARAPTEAVARTMLVSESGASMRVTYKRIDARYASDDVARQEWLPFTAQK